jgi:hypothetical protein
MVVCTSYASLVNHQQEGEEESEEMSNVIRKMFVFFV